MHMVIAAITAIAGLFWALSALRNSGFDPSSLNPFLWHRRAQWYKQHNTNPLYKIKSPMEAAAVVLLLTAKCEGEISSEQKQTLLRIFEQEFHLSQKAASDLLVSSAYLVREIDAPPSHIEKILAPSLPEFSHTQKESVLSLIHTVARIEGPPNHQQFALIATAQKLLMITENVQKKWG